MHFDTKNSIAKIGLAVAILSLALGVNYLYAAWTGPGSNTAPAGNVSTPINVSSTDQIKNGGALGVAALSWGSSNTTNGLSADQGGAIELGGQNAVKNPTNNATPYIDFHFGTGSAQDYNFRLINSATNQLSFSNSAGKTFVMTAAGGLKFPDGTTQTTAAAASVGVGTQVYICPSYCGGAHSNGDPTDPGFLSTASSCHYTQVSNNGGSSDATASCSVVGHLEP